jgi:hypothetical protein
VAFVLVALPSFALAQERSSLKLPTMIYAGAAAADVWSTADCLRAGCNETNPAISWLQPQGATTMLAVGEGLDAFAVYAVHKWIAPKHPTLAKVGLYATAGLRASFAASNWRQAALQRRQNAAVERFIAQQGR